MWRDEDAAAAREKGWEVDEVAGCIRAVSGGPHLTDARAQAVVARLAMDRHVLARKAWTHLAAVTDPGRVEEAHGLCMVEEGADGPRVAYFTRHPVDMQWGDGWSMGRPEENAGPPYGFHVSCGVEPDVVALRFRCPLLAPWDMSSTPSTMSVMDLNHGMMAWLTPDPDGIHAGMQPVDAGTGVKAFERLVAALGGWTEPFRP